MITIHLEDQSQTAAVAVAIQKLVDSHGGGRVHFTGLVSSLIASPPKSKTRATKSAPKRKR